MQILNKREQVYLYSFQTKEMLNQKLSQMKEKNHMIKINSSRIYHIYII